MILTFFIFLCLTKKNQRWNDKHQSHPIIFMPYNLLFFFCGFIRSLFFDGIWGAYFFYEIFKTLFTYPLSALLFSGCFCYYVFFYNYFFNISIWFYLASYSCLKKLRINSLYYSGFASLLMQIVKLMRQLIINPSLILIWSFKLALG